MWNYHVFSWYFQIRTWYWGNILKRLKTLMTKNSYQSLPNFVDDSLVTPTSTTLKTKMITPILCIMYMLSHLISVGTHYREQALLILMTKNIDPIKTKCCHHNICQHSSTLSISPFSIQQSGCCTLSELTWDKGDYIRVANLPLDYTCVYIVGRRQSSWKQKP